jgi:3'-phosphoadenosine 5'-phosphosulfate sulfotransferase (PAPS reductase)/FAD synthetase
MKTHAIQYSGGKDSLALMHKMRPMMDECAVYFGNTGAVYPHMEKAVTDVCKAFGAELRVVHPPIDMATFHRKAGLPSDIVPVEAASSVAHYFRDQPAQLLQSNYECCSVMLWKPLHERIVADGITTVWRGAKKYDPKLSVPPGHVEDGIRYENPLWDMTDADVFAYLDSIGAELPAHYKVVNASFDCWLCTAFLTDHGAERMAYTREHYPALWPELKRRLSAVAGAVSAHVQQITPAYEEAL